MHASIELDRKFGGVAIEIDDVSFDHLLTTEVKPVYRISPKRTPENALRDCHFAAQSLR